eukprot:SAG22_NODE_1036_length_5904_cov_4.908355_7_plen_84_part_00
MYPPGLVTCSTTWRSHRSHNKGHSYIIGLGNYTWGELVFTDKKSPHYGTHSIKNKWQKFTGDTEHYVKPFKGTRYTLVYYHWA